MSNTKEKILRRLKTIVRNFVEIMYCIQLYHTKVNKVRQTTMKYIYNGSSGRFSTTLEANVEPRYKYHISLLSRNYEMLKSVLYTYTIQRLLN